MPTKIWISTGYSRKETSWKNVQFTWEELTEKLKKPVVTAETVKEYSAYPKTLQDERKDVGGFVGGTIAGGRRKKDAIASRSLLVLDLDFAGPDFWDDFQTFFYQAAFLHGTRKHGSTVKGVAQHRYRLIMPLTREVQADEYEAVGRKVAGILGIDLFDKTTFQPDRLMFWPSVSKDQKFYFEEQEGPWLDPDRILGMYKDWKDQSQWAYGEGVEKEVRGAVKQQAEPTEKRGVVGAFCRAFDIESAISEFLPDVYAPVGAEDPLTGSVDRYTYLAGSTYGGLVIYDGKFAYSFHGTDPISGKLVNSFDLVRLHKFGHLDENVKDKTNATKYPSYKAMCDLAMTVDQVKQDTIRQRVNQIKDLFTELEVIDPNQDDSWMKGLTADKNGLLANTINNILLILRNDTQIKGAICWDQLAQQPLIRKNLPWRKIKNKPEWGEEDDASLRLFLEGKYNLTNISKINDAVIIISRENGFHPVKDYLESIGEWDRVERLERLLIDRLGAEDTVYTREVTRKTFVAAVARIYEPGIKFDFVLTLLGRQGMGKSTLIQKMGQQWYSDSFGDLNKHKEAAEQVQGIWLMEIGELAGFKKQEIETVKLFVSKQTDRFRVAYGKRVENFRRQCIFFGTSNENTPLQDPTGGRRFWVVRLIAGKETESVFELVKEDIDQLWAEACYYYTAGEDLFLTPEVEKMAQEIQALSTEEDFRKGAVLSFLETPIPGNWDEMPLSERINFIATGDTDMFGQKPDQLYERQRVTVPEVWCEKFRKSLADMTNVQTKFIRNIIRQQSDWEERVIKTSLYGVQRGWVKKGHFVK